MALGHRGYEDVKDILGKVEKIYYNRLCERVREAGLLKEFNKLVKRPNHTITMNKPNTGVKLELLAEETVPTLRAKYFFEASSLANRRCLFSEA